MRWIPEHAKAISELKVRLDESPRYGGEWKQRRMKRERLVSDRRLLRYLLKNGMNVERSAKAFEETLCWREDNNIDAILDHIVRENLSPATAPRGEMILRLLPQVPCSFHLTDKKGNPLSIEYYGFDPSNVMAISQDDYMRWFLYCMEYKMLVLDILSDRAEQETIALAADASIDAPLEPGWAVERSAAYVLFAI